MTAERIEVLAAWQDAASIEREALITVRDKIDTFLEECGAAEYPRRSWLTTAISDVDRSISQRVARIEELSRRNAAPSIDATQLQVLLQEQDVARAERTDLLSARDAILDAADDAGQKDLTDEQDQHYHAITRELAELDDEIIERGEKIETAAALSGV